MKTVDIQQYTKAVIVCVGLPRQSTSGGRVAAQVLLSSYNGDAFQLDVASMRNLDQKNYEAVITVIKGRYETGREPHELLQNGGDIFRNLWDRWRLLHVEERGKPECPVCYGRGKVFHDPDDEDGTVCSRCDGKGRVCPCSVK